MTQSWRHQAPSRNSLFNGNLQGKLHFPAGRIVASSLQHCSNPTFSGGNPYAPNREFNPQEQGTQKLGAGIRHAASSDFTAVSSRRQKCVSEAELNELNRQAQRATKPWHTLGSATSPVRSAPLRCGLHIRISRHRERIRRSPRCLGQQADHRLQSNLTVLLRRSRAQIKGRRRTADRCVRLGDAASRLLQSCVGWPRRSYGPWPNWRPNR